MVGSTTTCSECATMDGCQAITCVESDCPEFNSAFTCQCTPDCEQFDNCCPDAHECGNKNHNITQNEILYLIM